MIWRENPKSRNLKVEKDCSLDKKWSFRAVCYLFYLANLRCISTALKEVNEKLDKELESIKAAGTWKSERVITSEQNVSGISVHGTQGKILNFCANNYLGTLQLCVLVGFL